MSTIGTWLADWGGWIFGAIAAAIAIRGNISFDLNQWLEKRDQRKQEEVKRLCTHFRVSENADGTFQFYSTFNSPFGTIAWQCQLCGMVTHDEAHIKDNTHYWAKNPDKWTERNKEIEKLRSKL